jgi:inosine-uridine nucleoside N-ribohydrolase
LGTSPSATFVRRLIDSIAPPDGSDSNRFYMWDPLTASLLVEPAIGSYAEMRLAVVEDESPESGRVVASAAGPTVRVATSANRASFETSFVTTLR